MIPERALPAILYKYTSVENALRAINDKTLWFSSPKQFNDPFDCNINLLDFTPSAATTKQFIADKVSGPRWLRRQEIAKNLKSPHRIVNQSTEQARELFYQSGVCCFSAINHNILMWAHYANSHKGICLGFDSALAETATIATWVNYQSTFSKVNFWTGKEHAIAHLLLAKAQDWHYEQEIRLIKIMGCGKSHFDIQHLQEVIFGCETDPKDIAKIKESVSALGYSHIVFKIANPDRASFRLLIK